MRALILSAVAALALSALGAPVQAETYQQPVRHPVVYRHTAARACHHDKRSAGNQGTALGAVSGGVIGGVLGHGLTGGLIGAGVGAVAGHQIAKNQVHC